MQIGKALRTFTIEPVSEPVPEVPAEEREPEERAADEQATARVERE